MPLSLPTAILALALGGGAPASGTDCALAVRLDVDSFTSYDLARRLPNEEYAPDAAYSEASVTWAECRAADLTRQLGGQPRLRVRIAQLRALFRELRAVEGDLSFTVAGGGTLYRHAVALSYADIEVGLASLAALASTPEGGLTTRRSGAELQEARTALEERVARLRAWQPEDEEARAVPGGYTPERWAALVEQYARLVNRVQGVLGRRGDIATLLGYTLLNSPLYVDDWLDPSD